MSPCQSSRPTSLNRPFRCPIRFDIAADGDELVDVSAEEEAVVGALIERLMSMRSMTAYEGERVLPGELTPAQAEDMDALGYGGGK